VSFSARFYPAGLTLDTTRHPFGTPPPVRNTPNTMYMYINDSAPTPATIQAYISIMFSRHFLFKPRVFRIVRWVELRREPIHRLAEEHLTLSNSESAGTSGWSDNLMTPYEHFQRDRRSHQRLGLFHIHGKSLRIRTKLQTQPPKFSKSALATR